MFAAYKAHALEFIGAFTGTAPSFGGSQLRTEATGFGLIYFVEAILAERGGALSGQRVAISGKSNVATHAAQKALQQGAEVITLSDTSGALVADDGMNGDTVDWVRARKKPAMISRIHPVAWVFASSRARHRGNRRSMSRCLVAFRMRSTRI